MGSSPKTIECQGRDEVSQLTKVMVRPGILTCIKGESTMNCDSAVMSK